MLGKTGQEKRVQQLYWHVKGMGMLLLNFLACLGVFCSLLFKSSAGRRPSVLAVQAQSWTS